MDVFEKVDWSTIDDDKVVGSYIPMPDGSQHYIELSMLHWYWAYFYVEKAGGKLEDISQHALEVMASGEGGEEEGMSFDELVRLGLMAFGKSWIKNTTGRR